jgi:hypothetical protein
MRLREKLEIGDLRRRNSELQALVDLARVENVQALERENARLAAALVESRLLNEHLRASLKSAQLRLEAQPAQMPTSDGGEDKALALLRSPEISKEMRAHLVDLYDEAGLDPLASRLRSALVAMVRARLRGREVRPGTCDELAKTLHITHRGFFKWLIKRSNLVSVSSRDERRRLLYSLHLERLASGSDSPP